MSSVHILENGLNLCQREASEGVLNPSEATCDECLKAVPPEYLELFCPACGKQHLDIDDGEIDWSKRIHRTHKCVNTPEGPNTGCGHLWRPKNVPTFGVASSSAKV